MPTSPPLSFARLWATLGPEVKTLAARSFFEHERGAPAALLQAEAAIARAVKARDVFVHRLPLEKKISYLASAVRPDEHLASSLLLALHLEKRRPMLTAFLDELGIAQDNGVIADSADLRPPAPERLASAASVIYERCAADEVTVYFKVLIAMDPEMWGGLRDVLRTTTSN